MSMDMMGVSGQINNEQVKKERRLLQQGDIIRLESGMKVNADILAMFCGENEKPFDLTKYHITVCIGRIYKREAQDVESITEEIYDKIQRIIPVSKEQISAFVDSLNLDMEEKSFDTSVYAGEYKVYDTSPNTGGRPFIQPGLPYDDGWHVYCHKVDDPSVKVDFYQTGYKFPKIEDIEPINK